ncbi:MAG: nucleotide exchange factor GrpE [Ruminococcus sp.]|nr:nucleotide exchange factor GrpE [Ruminococcus sp.]
MTDINDMQAFCDDSEETVYISVPEQTEAGGEPEQQTEQPEPDTAGEPAPDVQPPEQPEEDEDLAALKEMLAQQHREQLSYISALSTEVEELSARVAAGNKAIAVHEEIEHNLNAELQRYKNDFYDKLATPFLMQFIGLYTDLCDEMAEIREEFRSDPENEQLGVQLKSLGYYADSVRGALTNNGVEIKTPEVGSRYDYKEQRISKTVPADDETLRDCIAEARSDAFIYNGKVLRPAKVVVYKV